MLLGTRDGVARGRAAAARETRASLQKAGTLPSSESTSSQWPRHFDKLLTVKARRFISATPWQCQPPGGPAARRPRPRAGVRRHLRLPCVRRVRAMHARPSLRPLHLPPLPLRMRAGTAGASRGGCALVPAMSASRAHSRRGCGGPAGGQR